MANFIDNTMNNLISFFSVTFITPISQPQL